MYIVDIVQAYLILKMKPCSFLLNPRCRSYRQKLKFTQKMMEMKSRPLREPIQKPKCSKKLLVSKQKKLRVPQLLPVLSNESFSSMPIFIKVFLIYYDFGVL